MNQVVNDSVLPGQGQLGIPNHPQRPVFPGAVIFDMDGVLIDSEVIAARVESELFAELGADISVDVIYKRFVGLSEASMTDIVRRDFSIELPASFQATRRARITDRFEREGKAIDGIPEVLDQLVGTGVPIAVASSSDPASIAHKLELTGLADAFGGHLYSASQVERGKPEPDLFIFAAGRIGVEPERCLVVEDAVPGVIAATRAGMKVLGFVGGAHCGEAHADRLTRAGAAHVVATGTDLASTLANEWEPSAYDAQAPSHVAPVAQTDRATAS